MQTRRRPTCGTSRPLQPIGKDLVITPAGVVSGLGFGSVFSGALRSVMPLAQPGVRISVEKDRDW
jgi:hypothetical protein